MHSLVVNEPYCDPSADVDSPSCGVTLGTAASEILKACTRREHALAPTESCTVFWVLFYTITVLIHLNFLTALRGCRF